MSVLKEVKMGRFYFQVVKDEYHDGNTALLLIKRSKREMCRALTINVSDTLPKGCVAIKDYSENTGTLKLLIENGIVGEPLYFIDQGFVSVPICHLKIS